MCESMYVFYPFQLKFAVKTNPALFNLQATVGT
jgi:hypothetical protein